MFSPAVRQTSVAESHTKRLTLSQGLSQTGPPCHARRYPLCSAFHTQGPSDRRLAIQIVKGFQPLGWSPGFSHGSHTPNRGVVEADATLPLWTSQQFLRPLVIACCDRAPSSTDEHAHDPVGTGLHTHPTDPLEPGKTLPQFTALRASCNAHHVGSEIEASSRCLTKCTSRPCDNLPRRPTSGKLRSRSHLFRTLFPKRWQRRRIFAEPREPGRLVEGTSIPRSTLALLVCGEGRLIDRCREQGNAERRTTSLTTTFFHLSPRDGSLRLTPV